MRQKTVTIRTASRGAEPDKFTKTVLRVLVIGGDNAGRAAIAGAILGDRLGYRTIPDSLRQQVVAKDRMANAVTGHS